MINIINDSFLFLIIQKFKQKHTVSETGGFSSENKFKNYFISAILTYLVFLYLFVGTE